MKKKIITLFITTGNYSSFIERIIELSINKTSSYICVANVHMTIEAFKDINYSKIVNNANLITPDGMPIAKAITLLYKIKQDRVAGMDLLPDLLKMAEKENLGIFFYGSTNETLQKTKAFVEKVYPTIKNHSYYSPPFRLLTPEEEVSVIKRINDSGSHLIFIALGCPKQEKWMASMKGKINACMIGIGGALPVMIGDQKRAPIWMQKLSLEWVYRLIQEPRRLFKRYLITNNLFIYLIIIDLIKRYNNKRKH